MCRLAGADSAAKAQTSHPGWQCGRVFCLLVISEASVAEHSGGRHHNALAMVSCVSLGD